MMDRLINFLAVGLGGALGSMMRYGIILLLLTVGICGGFTTYSTFALQNVKLFQEGKTLMAVIYVIGTVISCVLLAWLGNRIAK